MYDKISDFNYIDEKNNIKIISFSSSHKNCLAKNILNEDLKLIWLSEKEVPQNIIIDISKMIKKPKKNKFHFFGIHLWHAYQSNPKEIELYYSNDNKEFILVGIYQLELRPGTHFFKIENKNYPYSKQVNFIKINITKTYGGIKTYINQIFLLDTLSHYNNNQFFQNFYFENTQSNENEDFQDNKNIINNKLNNYNNEIKKKQKKFEKILKSDKILKKRAKSKTLNKRIKNKIDINTLSSNNNSSLSENENKLELPIEKKNYSSNNNFSFPSFSNSNYKSNDSTNLTTIVKMKNTLEKKNKDLMKEDLENKLKEMNDYLKIIGADNNFNSIKNSPYSFISYNLNYDNNNNIDNLNFDNNNNNLSQKVERIEKKINDIQNDVDDIKNVVLNMKKGINEINDDNIINRQVDFNNSKNNFYNSNNILYDTNNTNNNFRNSNEEIGQNYINTDNNLISEDDSDKNNINDKNYNMNINYNDYLKYSKNKNINNNKNSSYDSYLQNFDNKLSQKLDQLSNNIENQIYKNFIEPSLTQFNLKMKNSLSEMKKQIETISNMKNKKKYKNISSDSSSYNNNNNNNKNNVILSSDSGKIKNINLINKNYEIETSSSNLNNEQILQIKYQQITDLTNKLYKKLCDKEKILNEKADYLKGKLGNINSSNYTY
jgi:hypothetical protein